MALANILCLVLVRPSFHAEARCVLADTQLLLGMLRQVMGHHAWLLHPERGLMRGEDWEMMAGPLELERLPQLRAVAQRVAAEPAEQQPPEPEPSRRGPAVDTRAALLLRRYAAALRRSQRQWRRREAGAPAAADIVPLAEHLVHVLLLLPCCPDPESDTELTELEQEWEAARAAAPHFMAGVAAAAAALKSLLDAGQLPSPLRGDPHQLTPGGRLSAAAAHQRGSRVVALLYRAQLGFQLYTEADEAWVAADHLAEVCAAAESLARLALQVEPHSGQEGILLMFVGEWLRAAMGCTLGDSCSAVAMAAAAAPACLAATTVAKVACLLSAPGPPIDSAGDFRARCAMLLSLAFHCACSFTSRAL